MAKEVLTSDNYTRKWERNTSELQKGWEIVKMIEKRKEQIAAKV